MQPTTVYLDRPPPTPAHAGATVDDDCATALIDIFTDGFERRTLVCRAVQSKLGPMAQQRCALFVDGVSQAAEHVATVTRTSGWERIAEACRALSRKIGSWENALWLELGRLGKSEDDDHHGRTLFIESN